MPETFKPNNVVTLPGMAKAAAPKPKHRFHFVDCVLMGPPTTPEFVESFRLGLEGNYNIHPLQPSDQPVTLVHDKIILGLGEDYYDLEAALPVMRRMHDAKLKAAGKK